MAEKKFLDYSGLETLWGRIKALFVAKPSANSVTDGHVATLTKDGNGNVGVADSGFTIGKSVPSDAVFTDTSVSDAAHHYVADGASSGTHGVSTARYYIKTITTDAAGHVTGVTTGNETEVNENSATLQITATDKTNTRFSTSETSSSWIKFTSGTNKFTVSDGTNSFEVGVTPNIENNVTGTGTSGNLAIWNGAGTLTSRAVVSTVNDSDSIPTSAAVKNYVDSTTSGLTGAMHFIGVTTTTLEDGDTTSTLAGDNLVKTTGFASGDVVISGNVEFVWTGSSWEELGDEGSFAYKTVSITGDGALAGGGTLESNRTITHKTSNLGITQDTSYGPTADVSGTDTATIKVPQITVDKYGHIVGVSERTYTSVDHTYDVNDSKFSINVDTTNDVAYTTANASSPSFVKFVSGTNISLSTDTANHTITINATDTDKYVNSAAFSDDTTSATKGKKLTLTRGGSDSETVTATIPIASTSTFGVVKAGTTSGKVYGVAVDSTTGAMTVDVPWTDTTYTAGSGLSLSNSTQFKAALVDYTLLTNVAAISGDSDTRMYAVCLDANGKLAVTVPWTDTNTTYDALTQEEIESVCTLASS